MTARKDIERWLDGLGVPWDFVADLATGDLDLAASLANQARLEALDPEVVERYAADMERGDEFPPLLIRRLKRKLVALGGNHRLAAARQAKRFALPAFLVDVDDPTALQLSWEDNRRHGLPPGKDERVAQALHLVDGQGLSLTRAAELIGLSARTLHNEVSAKRAEARARRLDVSTKGLSVSSKARLDDIGDDEVFAEATDLMSAGRILAKELGELVTKLRELSREDALAYLSLLDDGRTRRGGGRPPDPFRSPAARLLSDLDRLLGFDPKRVAEDCANGRREALRKQCKVAARRLMAIEKALA